jgi:hypothetical protein
MTQPRVERELPTERNTVAASLIRVRRTPPDLYPLPCAGVLCRPVLALTRQASNAFDEIDVDASLTVFDGLLTASVDGGPTKLPTAS